MCLLKQRHSKKKRQFKCTDYITKYIVSFLDCHACCTNHQEKKQKRLWRFSKSRNIYQVKMQELPYFVSVTDADSIICCEACIVYSFCPDQTIITIRKPKLWVKVRLKFAETNQVVVTCTSWPLHVITFLSAIPYLFLHWKPTNRKNFRGIIS